MSYWSNTKCVHFFSLVFWRISTVIKFKTDYRNVGSSEIKIRLCVDYPGNKAQGPQ